MRIVDAAEAALKNLERASTVHEIRDEMVRANLLTPCAINPLGKLETALRRCTLSSPTLTGHALFRSPEWDKYELV